MTVDTRNTFRQNKHHTTPHQTNTPALTGETRRDLIPANVIAKEKKLGGRKNN